MSIAADHVVEVPAAIEAYADWLVCLLVEPGDPAFADRLVRQTVDGLMQEAAETFEFLPGEA